MIVPMAVPVLVRQAALSTLPVQAVVLLALAARIIITAVGVVPTVVGKAATAAVRQATLPLGEAVTTVNQVVLIVKGINVRMTLRIKTSQSGVQPVSLKQSLMIR